MRNTLGKQGKRSYTQKTARSPATGHFGMGLGRIRPGSIASDARGTSSANFRLGSDTVVAARRRLSDRQVPSEEMSPEGSRYGLKPRRIGRNHFTEEAFAVAEVVEEIATEKGRTPGQIAPARCKEQPGITSPIIGPRTMEPLEDTLGALNVEITVKNRKRLDEVARGELSWLITKPTWARTDFVGKESRSFPQDVT
jgi:hypothetical protein